MAKFFSTGRNLMMFLPENNMVEFVNGFFRTEDPQIINWLRADPYYSVLFFEDVQSKPADEPVPRVEEPNDVDDVGALAGLGVSDWKGLRALAKELGVPGYTKKSRAELIAIIKLMRSE